MYLENSRLVSRPNMTWSKLSVIQQNWNLLYQNSCIFKVMFICFSVYILDIFTDRPQTQYILNERGTLHLLRGISTEILNYIQVWKPNVLCRQSGNGGSEHTLRAQGLCRYVRAAHEQRLHVNIFSPVCSDSNISSHSDGAKLKNVFAIFTAVINNPSKSPLQ